MKMPWLAVTVALSSACRSPASADAERDGSQVVERVPPSAGTALDALDQRRPVPLLPVMAQHQKESMRAHLEAVQEVVGASAVGDFDKVEIAARRMGSAEEMRRTCEHMGAGAPGFVERALRFHETAEEIALAARKRDGTAVLSALSRTLTECTGCHATYKQHVTASLPE